MRWSSATSTSASARRTPSIRSRRPDFPACAATRRRHVFAGGDAPRYPDIAMTEIAKTRRPEPLQAVKGMNDLLPPESARWEWFESKVRALMARYGYANVRTPVVEPTALFVRGLGEVTDIVEKEMYSFEDAMNGDKLTLRPEATAGIVRAMIEHNALYNGPMRVWSNVSLFRHERPQKGRYRQFHQIDVEGLGFAGPD